MRFGEDEDLRGSKRRKTAGICSVFLTLAFILSGCSGQKRASSEGATEKLKAVNKMEAESGTKSSVSDKGDEDTTNLEEMTAEQTKTDREAYTLNTPIEDVIEDAVFGDYGRLLFPTEQGYYSGSTLGKLRLVWYHNMVPERTVEIANYLRDEAASGEQIFYDIYTEEEKREDPAKEDTGLFFFRAKKNGKEIADGQNVPTAIVSPGGGFAYVGSMQDSFPAALALSKDGINVFTVVYRPGAQTACEDLSRAIAFLYSHADELGIDMDGYSLWGGSAGARMSDWVGTYGTGEFGEKDYPKPAAVITAYTGLSEVTGEEPPTYAVVGTSDAIANYRTMQQRIHQIKAGGTDAEIEVFKGLSHGFGTGEGTVAEGWITRAEQFWLSHRNLSGRIPDALVSVPESYYAPAKQQGRLVRLDYDTWESFSYAEHTKKIRKTAWVYLPYGYTDQKQYNIFYLSHGGWSDETTVMGTDQNPSPFKNIVDHAIEDEKMQPMILVMPTYNNTSKKDSWDYSLALQLTDQFHQELINDLIPAVERKYSTYAHGDTSAQGLKASRDHRGFGGFSMGSVNTWHTFQYCLDDFRYFMPMSGSGGFDGQTMEKLVKRQGYGPNDFFIFSASGTNDFAQSGIKAQIQSMVDTAPDMFKPGKTESEGNVSYMEQQGFSHNEEASEEYTYNGLCFFWNQDSLTR